MSDKCICVILTHTLITMQLCITTPYTRLVNARTITPEERLKDEIAKFVLEWKNVSEAWLIDRDGCCTL